MPSLTTASGGLPSGRRSKAISRPAAQLPPSSTLASGNSSRVLPRLLAHENREAIEQGHRQRAPLDDRLAQRVERALQEARVARLDNAAIEEQAAVAVFGEARQAVEVGDPHPGRL